MGIPPLPIPQVCRDYESHDFVLHEYEKHIFVNSGEVDRFGVLANLKPLISAATDVMSHQRESMKSLWLESSPSRASRLFVRRIDNATLVVQFSKRFEQTVYISELERAAHLLKKVVTLGEMLS